MGCICSKRRTSNQYVAENHVKDEESNASRSFKQLSTSSGSEKVAIEPDGIINDTTARLMSNPSQNGTSGSTPISWDEGEMHEEITVKMQVQMSSKGIGSVEQGQPRVPRIGSISRGERGAQILAGWPSWLTSVAGEAISGWIPRRAESFEKLEKIGQGTYSSVYRARDRETNKFVALKKVRFANMDPESVRFMAREILVLRRLDHPNVMKLEGIISSRVSGSLYLIFEYMEHDLVGLAALPGIKLNEPQIKCYMQQLLRGLDHCHKHGVLHRDIKGSNLLVDNNGNLKIGDFGLATFFQPSQRQHLTSRVVTLSYRPPELLLGATDYGVAADLWSTGCFLAELFAGKPIMPGRTEVEQLHKIFKLCGSPSEEYWKKSKLPHATIFKPTRPYKRIVAETFNDLPSSALSLLEVLLAVEPENRGTASLALESEFFTTEPLPCDPSTMPKYPPSKEFEAKRREEEARRRRAVANKGHEQVSVWRDYRESKVVPAPDFNAELQVSIQKRKERPDLKCISEKYNPEEDVYSYSGQVVHPTTSRSSRNVNLEEPLKPAEWREQRSCMHDSATLLTRFSNSVVVRGSSRFGIGGDSGVNSQWTEDRFGHNQYNHLADGQSNQLLAGPNTSHKKASPPLRKELTGYASRKGRIHYSGPLLPPGGDVEEMLKEHERQIQEAVRKARVDKVKTKKGDGENGQTESLFHNVRNDK